MTTKTFIHCVLLIGILMSIQTQAKTDYTSGKYANEVILKNGNNIGFSFHLPNDFDIHKSYPALIGPGGTKVEDDNSLFWAEKPQSHGWIIIETSAMFNNDRESSAQAVNKIFDFMQTNFRIEGEKFHGIGWSANSNLGFDIAIKLADRFHSMTGLPGHPKSLNQETKSQLKKMKVNFIVGEKDSYWLSHSKNAHKSLKQFGVDSQLDVINNGGHILRQLIDDKLFEKLNKLR